MNKLTEEERQVVETLIAVDIKDWMAKCTRRYVWDIDILKSKVYKDEITPEFFFEEYNKEKKRFEEHISLLGNIGLKCEQVKNEDLGIPYHDFSEKGILHNIPLPYGCFEDFAFKLYENDKLETEKEEEETIIRMLNSISADKRKEREQ